MNFAYVNEIVSQLLSNTFSVFCGAGASADITNSKWEDIFCETTRKFYHRKLSDDIYFLADLEKHYYNADHFYKDMPCLTRSAKICLSRKSLSSILCKEPSFLI